MVKNIKQESGRATVKETHRSTCWDLYESSGRCLVWTDWLTWVTDASGAWFAPRWRTKRTIVKTVTKEIILIIIVIIIIIKVIITLLLVINILGDITSFSHTLKRKFGPKKIQKIKKKKLSFCKSKTTGTNLFSFRSVSRNASDAYHIIFRHTISG